LKAFAFEMDDEGFNGRIYEVLSEIINLRCDLVFINSWFPEHNSKNFTANFSSLGRITCHLNLNFSTINHNS
jgi:hypothetical protein